MTDPSRDLPAHVGPERGVRSALVTTGQSVERALAKIHDGTSAGAVFSPAEHVGDSIVITAAEVKRAGGIGFGAGLNQEEADDDEPGGGGGAGGGGQSDARPVAVITVAPDGEVKVRPVLDYTKIGLAVLAGALTIWRLTRKSRSQSKS